MDENATRVRPAPRSRAEHGHAIDINRKMLGSGGGAGLTTRGPHGPNGRPSRGRAVSLEIAMDLPLLTVGRAMLALAIGVAAAAGPRAAAAAQTEFPFGHESLLDVRPMKGSKRVPSLDIDEKGLAEIDLWCNSVKGQMVVAGDTITILTGEKTDRTCPLER